MPGGMTGGVVGIGMLDWREVEEEVTEDDGDVVGGREDDDDVDVVPPPPTSKMPDGVTGVVGAGTGPNI